MRETSLEEFVTEDERSAPSSDDEPSSPNADGADRDENEPVTDLQNESQTDTEAVLERPTTYESNPSGVACAECGTVVEERWRDGSVMVCSTCKTW